MRPFLQINFTENKTINTDITKSADIADYGYGAEYNPANLRGTIARVTASHRERWEIVCEYGTGFATVKASAYYNDGTEEYPTTGDFVLVDYSQDGVSRINATLPRRSKFSRTDYSGHAAAYVKNIVEQVVAANFDTVFIMQSMNANFNPRRLERYLTLALQSGANPVIILTKPDLARNPEFYIEKAKAAAPDIPVFAVSSVTGEGLDSLSPYMKPRETLVFLGSSGVGKSSLVNALAGETVMDVSEIREDDARGRHTTTYRQLIMLKSGVMIIDTPGMRELGMWESAEGLDRAFPDVEELFGLCKYRDCNHGSEDGCAIKAAIADGSLSAERWESYNRLKHESRFTEDKSAALREKREWHKSLAKTNKNRRDKRDI